eukprot:m.153573 g.153573  ORF g.153573 m.153573 type:complete len:514 (+) comp13310_c0_seq5:140-1681(+)
MLLTLPLQWLQPLMLWSHGIGGDAFCLYFDAKTKKVHGINGSGRAPHRLSLDYVRAQGISGKKLPMRSALTVTVPGAPACWCDCVELFGTWTMEQVLEQAIQMAEEGSPIHFVASHAWQKSEELLTNEKNRHGGDMLMDGTHAPAEGEVMVLPHLANTFKRLAKEGKKGFYEGEVAQAIIDCVQENGGVMTAEDLQTHTSTVVEPISVEFGGKNVYEIPPNGQGITALIALQILKQHTDTLEKCEHNSAEYLHILIEAMRLAFADTTYYVADMDKEHVPVDELLSDEYASKRAKLIDMSKAQQDVDKGKPFASSDTVYFTVVDDEGNACSFINSNYMGFGTGLVPKHCGFTLQNRGANFILEKGHPNCVAPNKRPYHTIIPALATNSDDDSLFMSFGVMGGFMQPQGHVQVLLNMLLFGMNPQEALDAPRFCIGPGHEGVSSDVCLEEGIDEKVFEALQAMGHAVEYRTGEGRSIFGRGQIIQQVHVNDSTGKSRRVFACGSDPRGDGMAITQ